MPPAIFHFLAKSISNMANGFYSYPFEFDDSFIPINVGVKQVHVDNQTRHYYHSNVPIRNTSHKPCSLCVYKGFKAQHYPLNHRCGVKKLSSQEILKIMDTEDLAQPAPSLILSITTVYPLAEMEPSRHVPRDSYTTDIL